jgi:subtilisin family serine protease
MTQSLPIDQTAVYLADQAANTYAANADHISRITQRISENRYGLLPLTDITDDKNRLFRRAAREGGEINEALERINGVPNFQDIAIVRKIVQAASSVCRIVLQGPSGIIGYGTGCLVAPNVLITNNHVLPNVETASRAIAQFNYELGDNGQILTPIAFRFRPDLFFLTSPYAQQTALPFSGRDFTLVAVEPTSDEGGSLSRFGYIRLDASLGKIIEGENCVVIQHPKGDFKKVVLKDIRLITLTDNFLIYEADTLPGSSGSLVLGLGTGEAVALHHSSVPRKDAAGNWLRKDGKPRQPGDTDDDIDWIGNEGVRVSCIVDAFNNLPIPDAMQAVRAKIVEAQTPPLVVSTTLSTPVVLPPVNPVQPRSESVSVVSSPIPAPSGLTSPVNLLYFEVLLTDQSNLQSDWDQHANELVPGLVSQVPLLPMSLDSFAQRMRYLTVKSADNPWTVAATIEGLPQVESCRPDLQTLTDVGRNSALPERSIRETESDLIFNDGTAEPNETTFMTNWGKSVQVKAALKNGKDQQRWWNWYAINWSNVGEFLPNLLPNERSLFLDRLAHMRLVQLDTGYSNHSKIADGYDTNLDFDFVSDDPDARDEEASFLLKFPFHGTRTASIVIGGSLATDTAQLDGNAGLLVEQGKRLTKLIPYRVAESVILIGRGKQVVDAANYAVRSGADVLFMCMGSYPRPMLEAIAREVYEKGVIWVCAAGNEVGLVVAPAMYPGTIAVAATNPNDLPWSGSSHGPAVDIAAPGEDVYVPFFTKQKQEVMVYGSGTSYATPQVAAAAMLWKARHYDKLGQYLPWQVVEAFRTVLKDTARKGPWKPGSYGEGILDIGRLLAAPLPEVDTLKHAYQQPEPHQHGVGIAEAAHHLWNAIRPEFLSGVTESTTSAVPLTLRGQQALSAFTADSTLSAQESSAVQTDANELLRYYFNQ